MKTQLNWFDELYAQVLSHDKSTIITNTYSLDRDVWMRTESVIMRHSILSEEEKIRIPPGRTISFILREKIYTEPFMKPKETIGIVTAPQLFAHLLELWYRRIVKIRLIVGEDEFVAAANFIQDIRTVVTRSMCDAMETYRSRRLDYMPERKDNIK